MELSRVYISIAYLMFEPNFVLVIGLFIKRIKFGLSLYKRVVKRICSLTTLVLTNSFMRFKK
jgi:hypothetical protein